MKPSSAAGKPISRTTARNAALMNQLGTPGLGSLMGRRWVEGGAQLILAVAGFVLVIVWFLKVMIPYYSLMGDETQPHPFKLDWQLLLTGAVLFAVAWFWSLATSFSLLREATSVKRESLENFASGNLKLDEARIFLSLATAPQWQRQGDVITRTFEFKDFIAAMKFVNAVAALAEDAWHHPDVDIRWNKVTLALTTHAAGGLTDKDFNLAKRIDALAR